jgi:hypothetical protein
MQTLRDAATLAILILVALTVRVQLDGQSVDLDLTPPAEAAVEQTRTVAPTSTSAEQAGAEGDLLGHSCDTSPVPTVKPVSVDPLPIPREFVWEVNGKRIVVMVGAESPADSSASEPTTPEPCDDDCKARLSC